MLKLAVALALKGKPVALSLYNDDGGYRPPVVAEAANAARLYGRCQVSATQNNGTLEDVMTDVMFELPEMEQKEKFLITESVVRGEEALFAKKAEPDKKSA